MPVLSVISMFLGEFIQLVTLLRYVSVGSELVVCVIMGVKVNHNYSYHTTHSCQKVTHSHPVIIMLSLIIYINENRM